MPPDAPVCARMPPDAPGYDAPDGPAGPLIGFEPQVRIGPAEGAAHGAEWK